MEEKNLATEMLHELKAQSKRWFIIAVIELIIIIATNNRIVNEYLEEKGLK